MKGVSKGREEAWMTFRFVAWTIKVRNKSGGSSSEWVWEAGRRPVPFVTL